MVDAKLSPGHLCRVINYSADVDGTIVEWQGTRHSSMYWKAKMVSGEAADNVSWRVGAPLIFALMELEAIPHGD